MRSDHQRAAFPSRRWTTIHNSTATQRVAFSEEITEGYLAFVGRLTANKGADIAIRVAKQTGLPLKIAGNISDEPGSRTVSLHMMADAMRREKEQYAAAKHIVCMSRWAARSVVERYQVDPANVHVVPAGSNFEAPNGADLTEVKPASLSKLRLGFLGKDWRRKNLNFVLEIAECLHARGFEVEVAAAGFAETDGPRHHLLRSIGYIDKHGEPQRFLDFMRSCHFTCLFSSAEAFGISNRESLRLGIPVLASRTGGIPDTVPEGCGHLFDAQASADEIADVIASYADNPDSYAALCARILERSATFTWESAVEKLAAIWNGSSDYSYERLNSDNA